MPDATRPTLYDFLVHEALTFYTAGEQAGAMVQDAFVLQADSPIFAPTAEFLAWNIESPDTDSPAIKAIRLFQKLAAFHQQDPDPTALAEAELDRLVFGYNQAAGEEKNTRYKAALQRFVEQWAQPTDLGPAREAWGQVLRGERQLVEARQVALPGWEKFPDSAGGNLCYNLIHAIEGKRVPGLAPSASGTIPGRPSRCTTATSPRCTSAPCVTTGRNCSAQENYSPGAMTAAAAQRTAGPQAGPRLVPRSARHGRLSARESVVHRAGQTAARFLPAAGQSPRRLRRIRTTSCWPVNSGSARWPSCCAPGGRSGGSRRLCAGRGHRQAVAGCPGAGVDQETQCAALPVDRGQGGPHGQERPVPCPRHGQRTVRGAGEARRTHVGHRQRALCATATTRIQAVRTDRLLHRPIAVSPGADHSVQGDLRLRQSAKATTTRRWPTSRSPSSSKTRTDRRSRSSNIARTTSDRSAAVSPRRAIGSWVRCGFAMRRATTASRSSMSRNTSGPSSRSNWRRPPSRPSLARKSRSKAPPRPTRVRRLAVLR